MSKFYQIIINVVFLFFTEVGYAQARFKAAVMMGINMSQIDGDKQQGFRKPGVSLGLNGSIYIRPDFEVNTELLYNEKGAKPNPNDPLMRDINFSTFSLRYSEIALLANYHYSPNSTNTYYTQTLYAGLSYGRLLKSSISILKNNQTDEALESEIVGKLNPHDFSFIVGWSHLFTKRIGITLRYTGTFNFLYKNPDYRFGYNNTGFQHLKPYFMSLRMFYNLVSPNKTMGLKSKKQKVKSNPLEELY